MFNYIIQRLQPFTDSLTKIIVTAFLVTFFMLFMDAIVGEDDA